MNHLVIDLEMCGVPKSYQTKEYPYSNEVIQIGAVLLDEEYEKIGELSQYVHPQHGIIDEYIERLTGIHQANVKHAPEICSAMELLLGWIGSREYKVYAWSGCDYRQLRKEMMAKAPGHEGIREFLHPRRWVDYQKVFDKRFKQPRATGLKNALLLTGLEPVGRLHNGMDDAINTARLMNKVEKTPDLELLSREEFNAAIIYSDLFGRLEILQPAE